MSIEFSKDQVLNALPDQEGKSGKFLSTDGTDALWKNAAASYANITEMLAGDNVVGEVYGAGGTSWRVDSISVPMTIDNYTALSEVNIAAFGALEDGSDCSSAWQAAIDYAAPRKYPIRVLGNYRVGATINLKTDTSIIADSARVTADTGIGKLFNATTSTGIENISIVGGDWFEDVAAGSGTVTFFHGQGDYNGGTRRYVNRTNLQRLKLHNFEWIQYGDFHRSWNIDNCFAYVSNGIKAVHKNVECNITNCIIFGNAATGTGTRGITVGEDTTILSQYPEGIKIHNCTIDDFDRGLSVYEVLDMNVTDNWIGAGGDNLRHCLYFGVSVSNFFKGVHFNQNTYSRGMIEFADSVAPPVVAILRMSDELYLDAQMISVGRYWHDISLDGWETVLPATPRNYIGINCRYNNERCSFKNMTYKGPWQSLIQVKDNKSYETMIDNVWADQFVDNPFYIETPIRITNSMAASTPTVSAYQGGQNIWAENISLSAAQDDDVLATVCDTLRFRRGALVELRVQGLMSTSDANGLLEVISTTAGVIESVHEGTGWDTKYIKIGDSQQRVDATYVFRAISRDTTEIELRVRNGSFTSDYHSAVSLRYI